MKHATVVVLGSDCPELAPVAKAAAKRAAARVVVEPSVDNLLSWMGEDRPVAVLTTMEVASQADVLALRTRASMAAVPVIGVTDRVTDLSFEDAFSNGYDDVCAADPRRLTTRLRQLVEQGPVDVQPTERRVVLAGERKNRLMTGRVFRNAGFQVEFANTPEETYERALKPGTHVVVVASEIHGRGRQSLSAKAWGQGHQVPWIVTTPPKELGLQRAALAVPDEARVAIHDAYSCPETLLFLANELVNRGAVEARSSERLLYGATVRFRTAGRDNTDIGYLFNISGGGVYVRTLAPPVRNAELWLEFTPPRCDRLVHLEGTAVWARRFGPGSGATVPAGFGLQITGASEADRLRYLQSYETFRDERQAAPFTMNRSLSPIAARSSLTAPAANRKAPAAPAIYIVPSGSSR